MRIEIRVTGPHVRLCDRVRKAEEPNMAIIKVYHGRGYDIAADNFPVTRRPARRDVLVRLKLEVLEDRAYEVAEESLDENGFLKPELMVALREDSAPG